MAAAEARKRAKQLSNPDEFLRIERFYNSLGRVVGNPHQIFGQQRIEDILRKMKQQQQQK